MKKKIKQKGIAIVSLSQKQIVEFGRQANAAAERATFATYQNRRPINTQRSQRAALSLFAQFMRGAGIGVPDLYANPRAWQGITWGLVQTFQAWLLQHGYSVKTTNDRVSTVKVYMSLANAAGVIPDGEIIRLRALRGFTRKESIDQDSKREKQGVATRLGAKKGTATTITEEQARALCKVRNETPQARRDVLLMCLLLDHGLRVSEVADLRIENIDRETRQMTFYRCKTGKTSRHNLRGRAWRLLDEYLSHENQTQSGVLLLASSKSGMLIPGKGLTTRAICERVNQLGRAVGIDNLSPHDCRHYGATKAGSDPNVSLAALMSWGGWDSPQSAARYINRGQADNDGVSLGMD
ncbi:MAG: site-specific integrase [Chloroflexi bacterium]|nr:site-specific integrase [Chloroflexota bacterium]